MTKYSVCSPVGGYGNHLRWLLILSKEFSNPYHNIDKNVFLKTLIYPSNRTHDNWLKFEWRYRQKIKDTIDFSHEIQDVVDLDKNNKIIVMISDPDNALTSYIKFNKKLNGHTPITFRNHIRRDNKNNLEFKLPENSQKFVIESDILYNRILDKKTYDSLVDFYNIENVYESAQTIHELWFDLHERTN